MTELRLSNYPIPEPKRSSAFKIVFGLLALAGVLVVLAAVVGFRTWSRYSREFSEIDHSADSIATSASQPVRLESSPTPSYQIAFETVYKNAKSGVTLRLPGVWRKASAPQITKPDAAHRFCILDSGDGLDLMFWPQFPDLLPSLDADADVLRKRYAAGGFVVRGQRELEIRGNKAKELEFFVPSGGLNLSLVIIRKWPVTYLLAITGSPRSQTAWERLENALPEAVDIP
jgi:hypothetical protein